MDEVVRLADLTCLAGNNALLSNIDWTVKKGEHWVVFGLNGSGKTTLLSIIAGFRNYSAGSVEVFGSPYTEENILQRSHIKSPVVRETELVTSLPKKIIKQKLLYKLSAPGIQALNREARFLELSETVNNLS